MSDSASADRARPAIVNGHYGQIREGANRCASSSCWCREKDARDQRTVVIRPHLLESRLVLLALQLQYGEIGLEVYSAAVREELAKVGW